MAERAARSLNHFALFSFTPAFFEAAVRERDAMADDLSAGFRTITERHYVYRIYPTRPAADLLLWTATPVESTTKIQSFFIEFARIIGRFRRYLTPVDTLWGFTRPSDYASGRPAQEIDPFDGARKPYLVIYPFAKTTDWYLMSRDVRQGMMNEHIRLGREYPEIMQLLLYSTGLQDQEFVVAYETDDLPRFSELVTALRNTEVRRYTLRDTPIYTAIYQPIEKLFAITD